MSPTVQLSADGLDTIDEVRPATAISYYFCDDMLGDVTKRWAAELHELIQQCGGGKKKSGGMTAPGHKTQYPFSGLLFCGKCGAVISSSFQSASLTRFFTSASTVAMPIRAGT